MNGESFLRPYVKGLFFLVQNKIKLRGMVEKYISPKEYESYLKEFIGKEITEFYYIIDCIVEFRAGQRFLKRQDTVKGETFPIYGHEYELSIWGHWEYMMNGKVIESTFVKPEEDAPAFQRRIGDFIETLHPKAVMGISVSEDGKIMEITFDNGGKFVVTKYEDTFVSYDNNLLDASLKPVKYRHARPEEFTGKLQYIEAS